jgi:hypothetical protein
MKFSLIILLIVLSFSCNFKEKSNRVINGIMIDCARLLERQDYYFRLIDFMAEWKMNTLILHFADDHGLSVQLPEFEKLSRAQAFTPKDIKNLIAHGTRNGIEIIPELEVFGHTRYITDHPDYEHLYVGEKSDNISFNAINPLEQQTIDLMTSMIEKVSNLFPSKYIHLGCDEVNLDILCKSKNLEEETVWTNYVNRMIEIAQTNCKTPIIWNDHIRKNQKIANTLNKNVVLMEWNYDSAYKPTKLNPLLKMGFEDIIMAPSIACYRLRVLPTLPGLKNTNAMAKVVRDKKAKGLINTIWLPMRYIQNAMWYGIAYSGYLINSKNKMNLSVFHEKFCNKVFNTTLTKEMDHYLTNWTKLHLDRQFYKSVIENDIALNMKKLNSLKEINELSKMLKDHPPDFKPKRNIEILESMFLATRVVYVISEGLLILNAKNKLRHSNTNWLNEMKEVIIAVDKEWDKGRYPDDPNKYKAKFLNQEHSHLLIVLERLYKALLENIKVYK